MVIKDSKEYYKISNGISIARIISMLWIFSVNYFGTSYIFKAFYGVEYEYAIKTSENFINLMNTNQWFIDKVFFVFSYAGWAGVVSFVFLTGFSLWFSILLSGKFRVSDYVIKRFNSIYVPYLFAAIIVFLVGVFITGIRPKEYELAVLIMGASRFVVNVYNYNAPLWFISMILLLYLFFPIIPIIYNKFRFVGVLIFTLISYFLCWIIFILYPHIKSPLYPLIPFWAFLCTGVAMFHIIYKCLKKDLVKYLNIACLVTVVIGIGCLYKFIYLLPLSDLQTPWAIRYRFLFASGLLGVLTFFSLGYLLPVKLHKFLRWLSRGTFAVFLYHYLLRSLFIQNIKLGILPEHLSIAFIAFYSLMLIIFSAFQGLFDKTIAKYIKKLSYKSYEIE